MEFKPVLCPSCGGKMRLPEGARSAICQYCGSEVIASGTDRSSPRFTEAHPIEKTYDWKPFDFAAAERQARRTSIILLVIGVLIGLLVSGTFGLVLAMTFAVAAVALFGVHKSRAKKIMRADNEMSAKGPRISIDAYVAPCPYCDSEITLRSNSNGANCPVCTQRIIIRDRKFYSVATPTVSVGRTE